MHKQGFTIIELLVVVLIVGILAAIAWPQFQQAVWKVRYTKALVLARQLSREAQVKALELGRWPNAKEMADSIPTDFVYKEESYNAPDGGSYSQGPNTGDMEVWCADGTGHPDEEEDMLFAPTCRLVAVAVKGDSEINMFVNGQVDQHDSSDSIFSVGAACVTPAAISAPWYQLDHALCKALGGKAISSYIYAL